MTTSFGITQAITCFDANRRAQLGAAPELGQVVRVVTPQFPARWRIFDVTRADSTSHRQVSGTIRDVDTAKDFRPKPSRLPIVGVQLGDTEELLALTAKVRPCVVLAIASAVLPHTITNTVQRNAAQNAVGRPSYLLAPAYSAAQEGETKAFGSIMCDRIQCMVYPQFAWLPRSGGIISAASVLRLDRAFWTTLPSPCIPESLFLHDEMMEIIEDQMKVLRSEPPSDDYLALVQLLRDQLPAASAIAQ